MNKPLNRRQLKFCYELANMVVRDDGEEAALLRAYGEAGYAESSNPANARRLANDPRVKAKVAELHTAHYEKLGVTADLVREQIIKAAMPDLSQLYDEYSRIKHPTQMDPHLLDAMGVLRLRSP